MRVKEGKWSVHLFEDSDGHLSVWLSHEDGTLPVATDADIADGYEWGERFTTRQIEREYNEKIS